MEIKISMFLKGFDNKGEVGIEQIAKWLLAIVIIVVAGIAITRGILGAG